VDKVLIYLGPSLPLEIAKQILPDAIYRPPCRQADLLSDLVNENPNIVILIDGEFKQSLSTWHKEWVYALQYPGIKAVYGAASMGALRAAELEWLGMVGIGRIFGWYRDGLIEDDAEVSVSYTRQGDSYHLHSVPLVDIRAGAERNPEPFAQEFVAKMANIHYAERTLKRCVEVWTKFSTGSFPCYGQKEADAIEALKNYRNYKPKPKQQPVPDNLSFYFHALYDRDRRIRINGQEIPQQHVDAYVLLHNPEAERICWDSANQELALILCDHLSVMVTVEEIERENQRFQDRNEIHSKEDFDSFMENMGWSKHEYDRLQIQNARIRKLHHCLTVSKVYRRNTQSILDYLRTHDGFDYWAVQTAQCEQAIAQSGVDEWLGPNIETPTVELLRRHCEKEGLELHCTPEEYLLETGFSNFAELGIALQRTAAAKGE
jgi:hypothetical protein